MDLVAKQKTFETARPRLMGIAYRLLGSSADAEDVVQDTAAKWLVADHSKIAEPDGWLVTVCTNRCLDILGSARVQRTEYVGPWLPDQLLVQHAPDLDEQIDIASSLTTAFLLLLERLTPKERAAYLLHDIFGVPFKDIADTLQINELNCRKLASRARKMVSRENVRFSPSREQQKQFLHLFETAVRTGELEDLAAALSEDVDFRADSGGSVTAARDPVIGRSSVMSFIGDVLQGAWHAMTMTVVATNSGLGLLLREGRDNHAIVTFGFDQDGKIAHIFVVRHPGKIARFLSQSFTLTRTGDLRVN
ncbi:RNA polymerase sigma factor SigJ [Roseibium sp. Sym1]|uniref:RNA polymerase sigma factor SigJ n=1 Tax=Roseibium sp. Sym1 TaxID=3016006 RepID=UPI0022B408FD|nr:RNA polymerase sigma factor SigJ [Roseibium sp. Sym1]